MNQILKNCWVSKWICETNKAKKTKAKLLNTKYDENITKECRRIFKDELENETNIKSRMMIWGKQPMETKTKGRPPLVGRFCISMWLLIFAFQTFCCGYNLEIEKPSTKLSTFRCPSLYLLFSEIFLWGGHSPS